MIYRRTKTLSDGRKVVYPFWHYRFKRNGQAIRINTKQSNKRTAEELEAAHRTRLAKGEAGLRNPRDTPTLKHFQERFFDAIKSRCADKPRTIKFYENRMTCLLGFVSLANSRLDRIDEAMIERFVQSRGEKISRSTVNGDLATLRRALRLAQEWRVIDRVPRVRLLPGEHVRDFVLSRELEKTYLDAAPDPLQDVALLILDTGVRLGEALNLNWADIDLQPGRGKKFGFLQIKRGKTKNAHRAVSLTARVSAMLKSRLEASLCEWVFPGKSLEKPMAPSSVAHQHTRVRDKLKLSEEFVIHSLRHTMLTRLGEAGVDAFTIMRIAGHSTITVSQRYVHPTPEAMESAFEKLEALNDAKKGHTVGTPSLNAPRKHVQVVELKEMLA
jgi:integrase